MRGCLWAEAVVCSVGLVGWLYVEGMLGGCLNVRENVGWVFECRGNVGDRDPCEREVDVRR